MSIYTRTGDAGQTSLLSGEQVEKRSARVRAYGAMDETQSALGMARALLSHDFIGGCVYEIQKTLMSAMSEVATKNDSPRIAPDDVAEVELMIDRFYAYLPNGFTFKVPGESLGSAALHTARSVVRRCERELHELNVDEPVNPCLLAWVNRVSDLCYVLARLEDEYDGDFDGEEVRREG